jgi:hypothetical protein
MTFIWLYGMVMTMYGINFRNLFKSRQPLPATTVYRQYHYTQYVVRNTLYTLWLVVYMMGFRNSYRCTAAEGG